MTHTRHGDVWMIMGSEIWRALLVGQARLAFVVDDTIRTVTVSR